MEDSKESGYKERLQKVFKSFVGCTPKGRTATQHSKNGSEKVLGRVLGQGSGAGFSRRRTNVQQLTCKIDLSNSFYYLFFSFIILELKPFVLKGFSSWGKNSEKVPKSVKKCEKL